MAIHGQGGHGTWRGAAGRCNAWQGTGHGFAGRGARNQATRGSARCGTAGNQVWRCMAERGRAGITARYGTARIVMCIKARILEWHGKLWQGGARELV